MGPVWAPPTPTPTHTLHAWPNPNHIPPMTTPRALLLILRALVGLPRLLSVPVCLFHPTHPVPWRVSLASCQTGPLQVRLMPMYDIFAVLLCCAVLWHAAPVLSSTYSPMACQTSITPLEGQAIACVYASCATLWHGVVCCAVLCCTSAIYQI